MTQIFDKKEDIMLPRPSVEQIRLWDEIEESLDEEVIELEAKFQALSDEFKMHFASTETVQEIKKIGEKHRFSKKVVRQLSYIVGMVLLGEVNIVNFVKTLMDKCQLSEEAARQLARDINQAIFLPVKESLKKIHQVPEWPREEQTNQPVVPKITPKQETGPRLEGNVVNLKP
ncbi:MAG: hypothetical protein ABH889_01275 [Candidatus Portnoybacteria bacterium]